MVQKPNVHYLSTSKRGLVATRSRKQHGFSLVELLVVILITMVLLAVGAVAAIAMLGEARASQTRAMLDGLKGANEEFKKMQNQSINIETNSPIDWGRVNDSGGMSTSERFVYVCKQNTVTENMMMAAIRGAGESSFERIFTDVDDDGYDEIRDRWGTEIEYRPFNDGINGTGINANKDKLPVTTAALFVSAGEDKEFGTDDDISTEDQ